MSIPGSLVIPSLTGDGSRSSFNGSKHTLKKIEIIPLAQRKADKRGIKTEWIEDAFSHPDQVVDGYGGRKVIHKNLLLRRRNISCGLFMKRQMKVMLQ